MLQKARIEDWFIIKTRNNYAMVGKIYHHPYKPDGREIQTSNIVSVQANEVTTVNTIYELGSENHYNMIKLKSLPELLLRIIK